MTAISYCLMMLSTYLDNDGRGPVDASRALVYVKNETNNI
jgi:hypothetical protein